MRTEPILERSKPQAAGGRPQPGAAPRGLRRATVLGLDIRGFSAILRRQGPLKAFGLLERFFAVMGEAVVRRNGRVDKILGDGMLALFEDVPGAYPPADRAALAALDMRRRLEKLNRVFQAEHGVRLRTGCGIETGEIASGEIGAGGRRDTAVIGEPVNAVFRLQRLLRAIPDGILLGPATLEAARLPFAVRPLEVPAALRRVLGHVIVYELLDPGDEASASLCLA